MNLNDKLNVIEKLKAGYICLDDSAKTHIL